MTPGHISAQVDNRLKSIIHEDIDLLKQIKKHIIESGGKRIRPLTHYYLGQMLHCPDEQWADVGAIGELIHSASLLHDDVIDDADQRRGKTALHKKYGNKTAILGGDYLLACGLDHLVTLRNSERLLPVFTQVIRELSVSELLQMQNEQNFEIPEKIYDQIIMGKTASLFGAMTESAAILSNLDSKKTNAYKQFGRKLGNLFQIRDDYLDYFGENQGKPIFQDFTRGLATKPLIVLRSKAKSAQVKEIKKLWGKPEARMNAVERITTIMTECKAKKTLEIQIEEQIHDLLLFLRRHEVSEPRNAMIQAISKLAIS